MTPEETAELRETIRAAGLRATPGRIATLQMMREANSPLSHADVATKLGERGLDKATAFRNLNDLTEAGLLRRSELGGNVYRFEEIPDDERGHGPHPHFVCTVCGTISCLANVELTAGSKRVSNQFGQVDEILLRGRCKTCESDDS